MHRHVRVDGRDVPYRLMRSPRARGVRIRVSPRGVVVSAPSRMSERTVARAVASQADWLARVLPAVDAAARRSAVREGDELPYLGGRVRVGLDIPVRPGEPVAAAVERWFRPRARAHLGALVERWAPRMGVTPARVVVRGQTSRWGSASARGQISLNWRLMMAPERIGEYVVVHELAHLVHMDHSPRFWALVEAHWPGHRADRDWLRAHGGRLLALGGPGPAGPAG